MSDFPRIQDQTITVAAGKTENVNITGEMLAIISATAEFDLSFNGGSYFTTQSGLSYYGARNPQTGERPRFQSISVKNNSGAPNVIKVQASTGEILDNRAVFGVGAVPIKNEAGGVLDVEPIGGAIWNVHLSDVSLPREVRSTIITTLGNGTVASGGSHNISGANVIWESVWVKNLGTETIFINTAAAYTPLGYTLAAGEEKDFQNCGDMWAHNPSAVSVTIAKTINRWA